MMTKRIGIIIAVVVVVLLLLGGIIFSQMSKPKVSNQEITNTQPQTERPQNELIPQTKGTISSLLAASKDVTCQMNNPDQNSTGTIYVSGNKFRGDFSTNIDNKTMSTHMIQDGEYAYMWSDGSPQGTKFKLEAIKNISPVPSGQPQTTDLDKEVNLNCSDWMVDNSKLTPPSDISFQDMSQMMNTNATSMPKMDASICDKIQDPASKAACLKSLNGN